MPVGNRRIFPEIFLIMPMVQRLRMVGYIASLRHPTLQNTPLNQYSTVELPIIGRNIQKKAQNSHILSRYAAFNPEVVTESLPPHLLLY